MTFSKLLPWLVLSSSLLASPVLAAEPARLVADLVPGSTRTFAPMSGFLRAGNRSVFVRQDDELRLALWATDGTAEGTKELSVLCPPCQEAVPLGSNGNVAFYRVDTPQPVFETAIWRTDGTPAGTFPLTEPLSMYPSGPGSPGELPAGSIQGGLLFFSACTAELGCELWASDGTPAGTALVGETVPGPQSGGIKRLAATGDRAFLVVSSLTGPDSLWIANGRTRTLRRLQTTPEAENLVAAAGRAWFIATAVGREVWASDGTPAGTRPVTSFARAEPFPILGRYTLTLLGGRAWFVADDGIHGNEYWSVGIRPGSATRATNFRGRGNYTNFPGFAKAGDRIVLVTNLPSGVPVLWTTRGDLRSTARLTGCPGGCPAPIGPFAPLGPGRLVFYGHDKQGGGIWVTDGTPAGTRLLRRTVRRSLSQVAPLDGLVLVQIAEEYETGELWVTDGTAAGTLFVTPGGPGWSHYYGWGSTLEAGIANGALVFSGFTDDQFDPTLWRSDASAAGSRPLLGSEVARGSSPQRLTPFRDGLLVQTCAGTQENNVVELRFVQGTETTLLLSEDGAYCHDFLFRPVVLGETAVFLRLDFNGYGLWSTDGTPEGTKALIPSTAVHEPSVPVRFGDEAAFPLFLPGPNGFDYQMQLWLTDGTPEGTRKQLDLPGQTEMYGLTSAGGRLWFFDAIEVENDPIPVMQPWVSDGTPSGTHPVTVTTGYTLDETSFTEVDGRVYFVFAETGNSWQIWSSDGTIAGTAPVVTEASGMELPQRLTAWQGRLVFLAARTDDPRHRMRPWVTEGTDGTTELLADVEMRDDHLSYFEGRDRPVFVEFDGRLWFAAADRQHGDELWSTDGTPEGTSRLLDIAPGLLASHPRHLAVWNGRLWFRARDGAHGMELWSSDGTARGTRLVQDINPGAAWSLPMELTPAGSGLYFSAHDGEHGRELWVLETLTP